MFDADDRYKQKQNNQIYVGKRTGEKYLRLHISLSPETQRHIETFRIKLDLTGTDQYVIQQIIAFAAAVEEMRAMAKKDPSFIAELRYETDLRQLVDFIYDKCDRNETEVLKDACQVNIDRWDDYELRRQNQQLRRSK